MINTLLSRQSFVTKIIAALGLTIAGILSHAPAEAAQYKISGKFAPEPGFAREAGGYFDGVLEIDDPTSFIGEPGANGSTAKWSVQLFNSQGSPLLLFDSSADSGSFNQRASGENFSNSSSLEFFGGYAFLSSGGDEFRSRVVDTSFLKLVLDQPNYQGKIGSGSSFQKYREENNNVLENYRVNIIDGKVEKVVKPGVTSVPEPMSVLGLLAVGAFGAWKTNKQQQRFREV
jgi:hypothetical protein